MKNNRTINFDIVKCNWKQDLIELNVFAKK